MTYRPLPVRLSRVVWGIASRAHSRQATFVLIALLAALLAAQAATAEPPQITAKRAEAERVLGEIHSLDVQMEKAIEAYNGATDQLSAIERERALNGRELAVARHNLYVSQRRLGARLRARSGATGLDLGGAGATGKADEVLVELEPDPVIAVDAR